MFGQLEPLDETVSGSNPLKIVLKRGNTHTLFQFVLTPLANRLVTPVGAIEVIQAQCLDDDTEQVQLRSAGGCCVSC